MVISALATAGISWELHRDRSVPLDMITKADCWIHGHTHDSFDYRVQYADRSVRVVCNPRGYPLSRLTDVYENHAFNQKLLVDVHLMKLAGPL